MKKVKSLVALLLAAMLVFTLVGCGATKNAEKTVKDALNAFQKADFEKVAEYFDGDADALTDEQKEALTPILEKVDYKILDSEEIDDETVKVTVEITTVDLEDIFTKLMEEAMSNPDMSEEEVMELFKELVNDKDAKTVTNEVDIEVKVDGKDCEIQGSDELISALFGGAEDLF